jgi:hypothetical protein
MSEFLESAGDDLSEFPDALRATRRYVQNIALWLARRPIRQAESSLD